MATGGGDDKGYLWRIGQGDWAQELRDHRDSVSSLAFSSDGQLLASGSFDKLVQVWDINSDRKSTLEGPAGGIEVAPTRTYTVGWFGGFHCLDVEC